MDRLAALFVRWRTHADVEALGAVFDRTAPKLLQLAMHLCHRAADAEDLLQATFLLAMRSLRVLVQARDSGAPPILACFVGPTLGDGSGQNDEPTENDT